MTNGSERPAWSQNPAYKQKPPLGKRGNSVYVALLAAALLLALFSWMWLRSARETALTEAVANIQSGGMATDEMVANFFEDLFSWAKRYESEIQSVNPYSATAGRELMDSAESALGGLLRANALWIVGQPGAFGGVDCASSEDGFDETGRLAILFIRGAGELRQELPDEGIEALCRKAVATARPALGDVRTQTIVTATRDNYLIYNPLGGSGGWPYSMYDTTPREETLRSLPIAFPIARGGRIVGAFGADFLMDDLDYALESQPFPYDTSAILLNEAGEIVANNATWGNWNPEGFEPETFSALSDWLRQAGADERMALPTHDDATLVYARNVELLGAEKPWTLVIARPARGIYSGTKEGPYMLAFTGWSLLLMVGLAVFFSRRAKANPDSVGSAIAAMPEGASEAFKVLDRKRKTARVLAVLFFLPSLIFMVKAEKRFQNALSEGNVREAEQAVGSMWTAAIVGVCIGIPILILNIIYR